MSEPSDEKGKSPSERNGLVAVRGAAPPDRLDALVVSEPPTFAGGLPAITSSMRHALDEMGVLRGARALLAANQSDGFDCPGCAWPDPEQRSHFEFCENGAKAIASEATKRTIDREFFATHSVDELAQQTDYWLNKQGRLTEPMIRRPGATHYEPIEWDDAFAHIAQELNALDSPDQAVFYTSGRTSNEAAFLYQLFVRAFGTNNLPDCSNMCHESSGVGLVESIGIGKGTVRLEDFDAADLILVIGQNPGTNHPRMLTTLQSAARRGCRIVTVNPLREAGLVGFKHPQEPTALLHAATPLTSDFVQVRINGDVALLTGIAKAMLEADATAGGALIDHEFIRERTEGFDAFRDQVGSTSFDRIERASGIAEGQIRDLAALVLQSKRTIACWAMGVTQHENGVANVRAIVNLLLLGGHFGRDGAGVCPVRGHSNVQGDRTMGIWEKPPPEFLDALRDRFGFEPPRVDGLDTVAAIKAMHAGTARVFFAMGGNFLSAAPDTQFTAAAMQRCALTVAVSTKLNRGHLIAGDTAIILPCRGRTELDEQPSGQQLVSVENSMGYVHASRGRFAPASKHLRSEPDIVGALAAATLGDRFGIDWTAMGHNYGLTRDAIAECVPGFDEYNAKIARGGFYLPNPVREGTFETPDGRAHFSADPIPGDPLEDGQLLMMTIRSHDQYNTTVYGPDDRYRGIAGERRVVFLNPADIEANGLIAGDTVDIESHFRGETRVATRFRVVAYDIPTRCCATYFPEANPLVPLGQKAKGSHTPASKSVVVSLRRAEASAS